MSGKERILGFTLAEMLVSAALVGILTVYLTETFTRQHRSYTVIDDVAEMQQNLRAIEGLLERELRMAGFMVPEAAAICGIDNTNRPDVLFVSDADAIDPQGVTQSDLGVSILNGFNGGTGSDTLSVSGMAVEGTGGPLFYDNDGDGTPDSDFRIGAGVIIVDRNDASRGAACGTVLDIPDPATLVVDYSADGGGTLGPASGTEDLVAVPAHVYSVNAASQLVRDGMLLAEGIEDLQFALFYDVDGNGVVTSDALERPGSALGPVYASSAWDNTQLREVRVNLVARSRAADRNFTEGQFQATENRVAVAGNDGFRRRLLTAQVRPRNVGLR